MTIEQKAWNIAHETSPGIKDTASQHSDREDAARLGLIEGVKMAAATVQTARFTNPESLRDSIEAAILDLIKEYEK